MLKLKMKKQSKTIKKFERQRNRAVARFPLVFLLLGTFGVVTTYYGLQHLLAKIPLIANNPVIALLTGLSILVFTGTLYKKLG